MFIPHEVPFAEADRHLDKQRGNTMNTGFYFDAKQCMAVRTRLGVLLAAMTMACQTRAEEPVRPQDDDPLAVPPTWPAEHDPFRVLVFSRTTDYRHESIPAGIAAIERLGRQFGFEVTATEEASVFVTDRLSAFRIVLFLSTSGEVLDAPQQRAFERFIQSGGGFVGIHAASATEYDWPWYGRLVGAWFKCHPAPQEADVLVEVRDAPSTVMLPERWRRFDEWYDYRAWPEGVEVLTTVDETTYEGATFGKPHPISWRHAFDGGRAWYTAMGHTDAAFREPLFLLHILGGIQYAAGLAADQPNR